MDALDGRRLRAAGLVRARAQRACCRGTYLSASPDRQASCRGDNGLIDNGKTENEGSARGVVAPALALAIDIDNRAHGRFIERGKQE